MGFLIQFKYPNYRMYTTGTSETRSETAALTNGLWAFWKEKVALVIARSATGTRVFIKLRQKGYWVLHKIRSHLGFGSLFVPSYGYWAYSVQDRSEVLTLINVINGNLSFNKTHMRFTALVNGYNGFANTSIVVLPLKE